VGESIGEGRVRGGDDGRISVIRVHYIYMHENNIMKAIKIFQSGGPRKRDNKE
jgi:hypothetical protein